MICIFKSILIAISLLVIYHLTGGEKADTELMFMPLFVTAPNANTEKDCLARQYLSAALPR
jgi:hypothetical protein